MFSRQLSFVVAMFFGTIQHGVDVKIIGINLLYHLRNPGLANHVITAQPFPNVNQLDSVAPLHIRFFELQSGFLTWCDTDDVFILGGWTVKARL